MKIGNYQIDDKKLYEYLEIVNQGSNLSNVSALTNNLRERERLHVELFKLVFPKFNREDYENYREYRRKQLNEKFSGRLDEFAQALETWIEKNMEAKA
tara:strand:+ start:242 stop:535 length:294 start_codon:yes stop_codon:yes gene_type:complete